MTRPARAAQLGGEIMQSMTLINFRELFWSKKKFLAAAIYLGQTRLMSDVVVLSCFSFSPPFRLTPSCQCHPFVMKNCCKFTQLTEKSRSRSDEASRGKAVKAKGEAFNDDKREQREIVEKIMAKFVGKWNDIFSYSRCVVDIKLIFSTIGRECHAAGTRATYWWH